MKSVTARRTYRGNDGDSEIVIAAGSTAEVSDEKAEQIARDFPEDFIVDASKAEREAIAAEFAEQSGEGQLITDEGVDITALLAEFDGLGAREALARIEQLTGDEAKALLREGARQSALEEEDDAEPGPDTAGEGPGEGSAGEEPDGTEEAEDVSDADSKSQAAAAKRRAAEKKNAKRGRGKRTTASRTRRTTAQ